MVPGDSGQAPRAREFYQLSRGTPAHIPGPAGLYICHGRIGHLSHFLQCQPALSCDSGSYLRVCGVDQLS